jgi:hypothetical protein
MHAVLVQLVVLMVLFFVAAADGTQEQHRGRNVCVQLNCAVAAFHRTPKLAECVTQREPIVRDDRFARKSRHVRHAAVCVWLTAAAAAAAAVGCGVGDKNPGDVVGDEKVFEKGPFDGESAVDGEGVEEGAGKAAQPV